MRKLDWIILASIFILIGIGIWFTIDNLSDEEKTLINLISIIASGITVYGLIFAIYQQFSLQNTSSAIKKNLENYQNHITKHLFNWQFERIIKYCDRINTLDGVNKIDGRCDFLLLEIQESLKDCTRFYKESEMENGEKSENDCKELIKKISIEINNHNEHRKSSRYNYDSKSLVETVREISDFSKDHKTTLLNA